MTDNLSAGNVANEKVESFFSLKPEKLEKILLENKKSYLQGKPFPHIVIDNFLKKSSVDEALKDFPGIENNSWIHYLHYNEKKHGLNKSERFPFSIKKIIDELNSDYFLNFLTELTGIENLIADNALEGGGLHQSERGGFLNIHADFTVHPHHVNWKRRINVLVYFNKNWKEEYGGSLELWSQDMSSCIKKVLPLFNRVVIFNTDETSYHGLPDPITCPQSLSRKSLALYYFTEEVVIPKKVTTNYKARPGDGFKALFIYLDKKFVSMYSRVKSILGINDDLVSKFLRFFSGKRTGNEK